MSNLSQPSLESLADAESVIEINSYDEMLSRVLFREGFDAKIVKPAKIIGWYRLNPQVVCGKSDCHQTHASGYLVVRSDGLEGNIGNRCGENHFGADFKVLRNQFELRRRVKSYRERLSNARLAMPSIWSKLSELKKQERGAEWLHETSEAFRLGCPQEWFSKIRAMAQRSESQVYVERPLTEAEKELRDAISGGRSNGDVDQDKRNESSRPQYARNLEGNLQGIEIWRTDIRSILIESIERRAQEFEQVNIFSMSEQKLLVWVRWYDSLAAEFSAAQSLLEEGVRFFSDENIKLALKIQTSEITDRKVRQLRWNASKFRWK